MISGSQTLPEYIGAMSPAYSLPDWSERALIPVFEAARHEPQYVCISAPPRHGKKIAHSTPVMTSHGWRTHGDLGVGDTVFGPDGIPTRITYVSEEDDCDLLVTVSDGTSIKAHRDHLWGVCDASVNGRPYKVVSTETMRELGMQCGFATPGGRGSRMRWQIPFVESLSTPDSDLPIDPYFMGLWLGDGSKNGSTIYAGDQDLDVLKSILRGNGHRIGAENKHRTTGVVRFGVLGTGIAKFMGRRKFVPDAYFSASDKQRRTLLMGLIDSDGHVCKDTGRVRFVNTSRQLIDDVVMLVSSIGYRTTVTSQFPTMSSGGIDGINEVFTVQWTPHDGKRQAMLDRKDHRAFGKRRKRSIVSIEECVPEKGRCISVDNDSHLYLVGKTLVPTHNTYPLLHAMAKWVRDFPRDTCAYASFNVKKGRSKSKIIRDLATRSGVDLDPALQNLDEWRTVQGGGLLAGGLTGGGLTGEGIQGVMAIDDPFPDPKSAESQAYRDEVYDNFNAVVMTRLEGASVIVQHTRWHADDLIGRLEKLGGWKIVNIPAIAEQDDYLGRPIGAPLDPIRYPLDIDDSRNALRGLNDIKGQMSSYAWNALYRGSPSSAGGNIIKRDWIQYYDELPSDLTDYQQSWDLTFKGEDQRKKKDSGSYVVGQVWARRGADLFLVDQYRGRPDLPGTLRAIKAMSAKHPKALRKLVEDAAVGAATVAMLRDETPGLILVGTKGQSKRERLHLASTSFEAGNVWFPRWAKDVLVEELVTFPNAANDDQVDALSMSINNYRVAAFTDFDLHLDFGLKTENWRY